MTTTPVTRRLSAAVGALSLMSLPMLVQAHDGHGAGASHWHATDTWGFVVTIALAAAAVWFGRRK